MAEIFLNISRIKFGSNGRLALAYNLAGDNTEKVIALRGFGHGTFYPRFRFSLATKVWDNLNNQPELPVPRLCEKCPPNRQQLFWRTFAPIALDSFLNNDGRGKWFDEARIKYQQDRTLIERDALNIPGLSWFSQDPTFALNVGIARGLITGEPITLMGVNICEHDLSSTKIVNVAYSAGDSFILKPVTGENITARPGFSHGILIEQVPQTKLKDKVLYKVDLNPFLKIREALVNSGRAGDRQVTSDLLYQISNFIYDILKLIQRKDNGYPEYETTKMLPITFRLFLEQMVNA